MEAITKFVTAFLAVVVGVALITSVATSTNAATSASVGVSNEAVSLATARVGVGSSISSAVNFTLAQTGPSYTPGVLASSITVTNGTGTDIAQAGNWTFDTVHNKLAFINNTYFTSGPGSNYNATLVSYNAYPAGYLTQGWDATVLNLVPGFFAIGLLGVGIWLFYSLGKDFSLY